MGLLGFEFKAPEVATIVRWLLRVVLVVFLAWLVKGRTEQDQEEEGDDEAEASQKPRQGQARGQRPNNNFRQPPRQRDPYSSYPRGDIRQRRPVNSESVDFDAVINKMSKPKQMWEVRKGGEAPQIIKPPDGGDSSAATGRPELQKKEGAPNHHGRKSEEATSLLKKPMLQGHTRPVTWITWNRDGNLLFTCGKDKKVCVWSFPDGECLGSYEGHSGAVWACSVTVDSSWLVTGGADQNCIVWEARASREVARIELPGVCRFVEWASTGGSAGERFATVHNKFGSHPPAITVWHFNGEAIEQQRRIDGLPGAATQVRWGLSDKLLVSAHENGELIFWQADTGAEVRRLKAHESPISKIDFSADRLLVATASIDMKVKVWDLGDEGSDGKLLYELATDRPLNAVALGPLTRAVAVGPETERPRGCSVIAAGGQDIRDVALSKGSTDEFDTLLYRIGATALEADGSSKGHFGPVHTLAFREDGAAMASGSEDGCVRLHLFNESALK